MEELKANWLTPWNGIGGPVNCSGLDTTLPEPAEETAPEEVAPEIDTGAEPVLQPGARGVPSDRHKAERLAQEVKELRQQVETEKQIREFERSRPVKEPQTAEPAPDLTQKELANLSQREIASLRQNGWHWLADQAEQMKKIPDLEKQYQQLEQRVGQQDQNAKSQRQIEAWNWCINFAHQGNDLTMFEGRPKMLALCDGMFFQAYGGQLLDANERLAMDPRSIQAHYGEVMREIKEFADDYHQKRSTKNKDRLAAAAGASPEKGGGPSIAQVKPFKYPTAAQMQAMAKKEGCTVEDIRERFDAKSIEQSRKMLEGEE